MALLNNKIALVTSSTRGIGYYTAKKLASKGAKVYLAVRRLDAGKKIAEEIKATGVKNADAFHVACAILGKCDYFITTDDRLLKYQSEKIQIVTPGEFIRRLEAIE